MDQGHFLDSDLCAYRLTYLFGIGTVTLPIPMAPRPKVLDRSLLYTHDYVCIAVAKTDSALLMHEYLVIGRSFSKGVHMS